MPTRYYNAGSTQALRQFGVKTASFGQHLKEEFHRGMVRDVAAPALNPSDLLLNGLASGVWSAYKAPDDESTLLHAGLGGTGGLVGSTLGGAAGKHLGSLAAARFGLNPLLAQYIGKQVGMGAAGIAGMAGGQAAASKINKHYKKPAKGAKEKTNE